MSPNAASGTAIERARLAYDELKRRQHGVEVQRRARERSRNITLAAIVTAALLLVAGIAIYSGGIPDSSRETTQEARGGGKARAKEARTGQVRSYVKGNTCRELQFNNDSGTFVQGNLVPCDPSEAKRDSKQVQPQAQPQPNGARINSIRDGFAR